MIIKDFKHSRHLSSRLEIGVDDKLCEARIGRKLSDILVSMQPVLEPLLVEPEITGWEAVADFHSEDEQGKRKIRMQARDDGRTLTAWWLQQIHQTQYPLLERMTLFWHNHFTSSMDKVRWPQLMYRQNQLLRRDALGNFAELLRNIVRDPAMLRYLDGMQNVKSNPNENFARELLELFTLGEGYYSEQDIVEAARAFSGWGYHFVSGEFRFKPNQHDNGVKTFMGQTGNLNGDDIVDILLAEERTAIHIAEKFWGEFINHAEPDPVVVKSWADVFRESGYDIMSLLEAVVHSQVFWDESNRAALIKSPVEFTVGMLRELNLELGADGYKFINKAGRQLGQELFNPPDVKGWRGGKSWISNSRLLRRYDLIPKLLAVHSGNQRSMLEEVVLRPRMDGESSLVRGTGMFQRLLSKLSCNVNDQNIIRWLLPVEPVEQPNCTQSLTDMFMTLLKDPAYQLR